MNLPYQAAICCTQWGQAPLCRPTLRAHPSTSWVIPMGPWQVISHEGKSQNFRKMLMAGKFTSNYIYVRIYIYLSIYLSIYIYIYKGRDPQQAMNEAEFQWVSPQYIQSYRNESPYFLVQSPFCWVKWYLWGTSNRPASRKITWLLTSGPNPQLGSAKTARSSHNNYWSTWRFPKRGVPQNGWFAMETAYPIKVDDLGLLPFWENPRCVLQEQSDLRVFIESVSLVEIPTSISKSPCCCSKYSWNFPGMRVHSTHQKLDIIRPF